MDGAEKWKETGWLEEQLRKFIEALPRYQNYASVLKTVLEKAAHKISPLAIVQTRPKSIASFGEKALQKKRVGRYSDPINRMTDLCGGRVIVPTKAEVKLFSEFLENHFEIDRENSVDVSVRLKPAEFGYRGVHYIIQFKRGVFPAKDFNVEIPEEVFGLRAEVQVKTILEHAWGVFSHDRAYKGAFKIPQKWEREIAALGAILEDADKSFARIEEGLKRYAANYGAYMTNDRIRAQIANLKVILEYDPKNTELAARIGKLALTLGDWPTAVDILTKYVNSGHPSILRDIGVATCKLYEDKPESREFKKGRRHIEAAIAAEGKDTDAISSLAGTYKGIDEDRARTLYRQAFEIDPSDPYPLGNYLECEVSRLKDITIIFTLRSVIDDAIKRCRDQIDVGMNLPWAFYDTGKFYLLLGKPHESLAAYAKAVQLTQADWQIATSLESLEELRAVRNALSGFEWIHRLLLTGLAVKFPGSKAGRQATRRLGKLASTFPKPLAGPVIIVAGGCDAGTETKIKDYRQIILAGFRDFHGTVISGGATAGISGLTGDIGDNYPDAVRTIGYIPRKLPAGTQPDERYNEVYHTPGLEFSPLESLQYWTDIITSKIPLSRVKVLGISGGAVSAAEYRIALALGVTVAILENSGREADRLFTDGDWANSPTLIGLPEDTATIEVFIGGAGPQLEPEIREVIARAIHDNYRAGKARVSSTDDPASAPWEQLPVYLRESNFRQADDISNKLRRINCSIRKVTGRGVVLMQFTRDEIEAMAEMEHGRWNIERLLDGWRRGKRRDINKKVSPYLVPWTELPENIKEWDRQAVRIIPELLAKVNIEIDRG